MSIGTAFGELGRTPVRKKSSEIPVVAQDRRDAGVAQVNKFREKVQKTKRPITSPKNR